MRGESRVIDCVDQADWIGMSPIVLGELRAGFLLGDRAQRNEAELQRFLSNPVVARLHLDYSDSEAFADLFSKQRRRGRPIPTNDLWIAAQAVTSSSVVLTLDEHFSGLPGVNVELVAVRR